MKNVDKRLQALERAAESQRERERALSDEEIDWWLERIYQMRQQQAEREGRALQTREEFMESLIGDGNETIAN